MIRSYMEADMNTVLVALLIEAENKLAAALLHAADLKVADFHDLATVRVQIQEIRKDYERER
jgi:hypothetical protein